jgi:hypothetical protein
LVRAECYCGQRYLNLIRKFLWKRPVIVTWTLYDWIVIIIIKNQRFQKYF